MRTRYLDITNCAKPHVGTGVRLGRTLFLTIFAFGPIAAAVDRIKSKTPPENPDALEYLLFSLAAAMFVLGLVGGLTTRPFIPLRTPLIEALDKTQHAIRWGLARWRLSIERAAGWPTLRRRAAAASWVGAGAIVIWFGLGILYLPFPSYDIPPGFLQYGETLGYLDFAWRLREGIPIPNKALPFVLLGMFLFYIAWRTVKPQASSLRRVFGVWAYRLAAIVIVAFSIAIAVLVVAVAQQLWAQPDDVPWYVGLVILGILVALAAKVYEIVDDLMVKGRLLTQPNAGEVRRGDSRKPILHLRSFHDDTQLLDYEMSGFSDDQELTRLEEAVARRITHYGPYIAIGRPSAFPEVGAARDFVADTAWRDRIIVWMNEALLITLIPSWTEGLKWEFETAIAQGHAHKLLILLPLDEYRERRWAQVLTSFKSTQWEKDLASVDARVALALFVGSNGPTVICSGRGTVGHYESAIDLAVYCMFCCEDDRPR